MASTGANSRGRSRSRSPTPAPALEQRLSAAELEAVAESHARLREEIVLPVQLLFDANRRHVLFDALVGAAEAGLHMFECALTSISQSISIHIHACDQGSPNA